MSEVSIQTTAARAVRFEVRAVSLTSAADLDTIAALHMELLDYGPMAGLGKEFIREICYADLMRADVLTVALAQVDDAPAGFIAFTPVSLQFHRHGLRQHWARAGWYVLRAIATEPARIPRLLRAVRVLLSRREEQQTHSASGALGEVVCVAVRAPFLAPRFMRETGLRISESLIRHAARTLRYAGVASMRMVVDADNKPVLLLYHHLGARFEPYEQAGEPRVEVWFDLASGTLTGDDPLPPPWRDGTAVAAGAGNAWARYWEQMQDDARLFGAEAEDYMTRLRRLVPLDPDLRVLDFGCGFAHVATQLAPHVGELWLWDASSQVRRFARLRAASSTRIRLADLSDPESPALRGQFDLITAHSVVQYIETGELRNWLSRWRSMLAKDGRIVLSDLIDPDSGGQGELAQFLAFSLRHRFFFTALRKGSRELGRYARARSERPLTALGFEELAAAARLAGLDAEKLSENLGYRRSRYSVLLRAKDDTGHE